MPQPGHYQSERFPIKYSGSGEFNLDGVPSGAAGAVATMAIGLNNRPTEITGIRVTNSYEITEAMLEVHPDWLARIDEEQILEVNLAQQNVVVRAQHQRVFQGAKGIHYHNFSCPYPFRGGNNIIIRIRRLHPYPAFEQVTPVPVAYVDVEGWTWVTDELPPGQPPSTDYPPGMRTTLRSEMMPGG